MASKPLTAIAVKNAKPGKYNDGSGLWLHKRVDGGAQWFLRYTIHGKRREMGLGKAGDKHVSLKAARTGAAKWREVVASGRDPIQVRDKENRAAAEVRPTFGTVADLTFEARKNSLKGGGSAGRWFTPLKLHVLPSIGRIPIEDIDQNRLRDALKPIWNTKAETARKAMNRVGLVMKHGAAMGLDVDLSAAMKAKALLGAQKTDVQHIPSMAWREVPEFYSSLSGGGVVDQALRLVILSACRSGEVRTARWEEIDLDAKVWTVPAAKTKAGKSDHRVPLSDEMLMVLEAVKPIERDGWVFPTVRKGCVSDMAMSMLMRRRDLEARPHGFRSSFRDWCSEATDAPREIAEMCLGHTVGSEVERAYARSDLLEKRAALMQRWADHCAGRGSALAIKV